MWEHFMAWLEDDLLPELPEHGGDAAPDAVKTDATNYCGANGPFEFIPVHVGTIFPNSTVELDLSAGKMGFTACYNKMTVSYTTHAPGGGDGGDRWGYIHFTRGLPRSLTCDDFYGVNSMFNSTTLDVSVVHSVVKKMHINYTYAPGEWQDIQKRGLAINVAPCGLAGTVTSALATAGLFAGLNGTSVEENNKAFLVARGLFPSFQPFGRITPLDTQNIKSGDVLQVLKLDGLDPLIAWGTGGRTGHTTIAVWEGDTLYVCESTDASPTGAYWPPPYGIIRHEWGAWLALADKAGFSVDILPLSAAASAQFDEAAYWKWYGTVQGMPYGYHVMLYSFLDTSPNRNLPKPMDDRVIENSFRKLDHIFGHDDQAIGANMYSLIVEGLDKRLGLDGAAACKGNGSFACVTRVLSARDLTFPMATAAPEQDEWRYDATPEHPAGNVSMMCSAFVANALKVGLGAHWPALNAHEFTPKDVYQLAIYDDGSRFTAANCAGGLIADAAGRGSYCQLLGPYVLPLNGYNSVPVTAHMNERCAAQWPDYETARPC
eukprot:g953.t1